MSKKQAIALVWYCRTEKGWRRFPVVLGANNRIKLGYVLVDGILKQYSNGRFELRYYEGRKAVYKRAGTIAADAMAALDRERHLHSARDSAAAAGVKLEEEPTRLSIRKAAQNFIRDAESRAVHEAAEVNRLVMDEFIATVSKTFVDEITREDVLRFHAALRKRGLSDRTVSNKDDRLRSFLRFCKVSLADIMPPKPKYEETLPTTYEGDEIRRLLKSADGYMQLTVELGLKCGLREQEIVFLEWADVDFKRKVLRVVSKPLLGFKVKDSEQREIPVPRDLLRTLSDWRKKNPETRLVLPTAHGTPNRKLLRTLKRLAKRSGLNCKNCRGCRSSLGECQEWTLHKLRRTYATTLLRSGMDLSTVQRFMGHSDLASTMRYLRPASTAASQDAINAIAWT
jgi:integrase